MPSGRSFRVISSSSTTLQTISGGRFLATYGVRSVVRNGDQPALLPPGFVESLKAREIDGAIQKPGAPFKPGQAVTINGGPFDGFLGQILELRESDRVFLLLELLNQQTKVLVETKMLRSA